MQPVRKRNFAQRLLIVFAILALLCVTASIIIAQYVQSKGGLNTLISHSLSQNNLGIEIVVGETGFAQNGMRSVDLLLGDIHLRKDGHQIHLPQVMFRFGWHSLYRLSPEKIMVHASQMRLIRQTEGLGLSEEPGWFAEQMMQAMQNPSAISILPFWLQNVKEFSITGNQLTLLEEQSGQSMSQWSDISVAVMPQFETDSHQLLVKARAFEQAGGSGNGRIQLEFVTDLFSSLSAFKAELKDISAQSVAAFIDMPDSIGTLPQTVLGGVFSGAADGLAVQNITGEGYLHHAQINHPQLEDIAGIEHVTASFNYSAKDRLFIITQSNAQLDDGRQFDFAGQFYGVGLPDVSFKGKLLAQDVPVEQVMDTALKTVSAEQLNTVSSAFSGGLFQTITAEFSGMLTGLKPYGLSAVRPAVSLSDVKMTGDFVNLRLDAQYDHIEKFVGTLKGKIELDMLTPQQLDRALISVQMTDGRLGLADFSQTIRLPSADLSLRFSPEHTTVQRLDIRTQSHGQIQLKAERKWDDDAFSSEIVARSEQLDANLFNALWPENIAVNSRKFVTTKFQNGRLEKAEMKLSVREEDRLRLSNISGQFDYVDGQFLWLDNMPPVHIETSQIIFDDNMMVVTSEQAQSGSIEIKAAEITLSPVLRAPATPQRLEMVLRGEGREQTVLALLDHPRVNQLRRLGLDRLQPQAELDFRFTADAEVMPGTPLKLQNIEFTSALSEASFDNLPLDTQLTDGVLELNVAQGRVQLSGDAALSEIPVAFSFLAEPNGDIQLNAELQPHSVLRQWLSDRLPVRLENQLGAQLMLTGNLKSRNYQADINSDLAPLAIYVEQLDWGKLTGESGQLTARLDITDNRLAQLDIQQFSAANLNARGRILFSKQGALENIFMEEFTMPGTALTSFILERDSRSGYRLFAEGRKIDISPLTRFAGGGEHPAFSFDVTAEEIKLGEGLKVSGNVVGEKQPDAQGSAILQGTVTTDGVTRFDQASLNIGFGSEGVFAKGSSLIGGAEAMLSYQTLEDGTTQLYIVSQNAGRVLNGLSVTDAIKGGKLELNTVFSAGDRSQSETRILIDDFRLIKGAKAVRVYAVLSPTGLFSLVDGEGTFFNRGEAIINSSDGVFQFKKMRATGASVGLGLVGEYDSQSGQVEVSGNLVPVNAVSDVIGLVPLIGEILTGIDKSGVLVTQFSVNGHVDDLNVKVNPVTLLVPGLLRDLFSPNWLESEAERIFGTEAQATQ